MISRWRVFGMFHYGHTSPVSLYRIIPALKYFSNKCSCIRPYLICPGNETVFTPARDCPVLFCHMFIFCSITPSLIVISFVYCNPLAIYKYFYCIFSHTQVTGFSCIGVGNTVVEAVIFHVVIVGNPCLPPVAVLVSLVWKRHEDIPVYLFKGGNSVSLHLSKWPSDKLRKSLCYSLVYLVYGKELNISYGGKYPSGYVSYHILIGCFIFWPSTSCWNYCCGVMVCQIIVASV